VCCAHRCTSAILDGSTNVSIIDRLLCASAHRCTSAGRLTSVCNGLINTWHSGPRRAVIRRPVARLSSLACSLRPAWLCSLRMACQWVRRPAQWTGALGLRISGVVLSLLHLCLWLALVHYGLYLFHFVT